MLPFAALLRPQHILGLARGSGLLDIIFTILFC